MTWYRVRLTAAELQVVNAERESHPHDQVRRKMLVVWLLHCGLTREKTPPGSPALGRATVQRYVAAFRDGGLDGLRRWDVTGPVSDLAAFTTRPFGNRWNAEPARTIAEACERIEQSDRACVASRPQVRKFLEGLGPEVAVASARIPVPPKKSCPNTSASKPRF